MADSSAPDQNPFSLLDRFPATPIGHIAFLEFVRDEVHYAADAKRQQLAQGYSNETLASMVSGVKWTEASLRVAALFELPTDTVAGVARVLRRELSVSTLEQIDELLGPSVRSLRDSWENRDLPQSANAAGNCQQSKPATTKAKRSIEAEEGQNPRSTSKKQSTEIASTREVIPAEYREGGKPDGELLTVAYVSQPEKYNLKGPFLAKQKLATMKHGRAHVYRFEDIARLSAAKNLAENDGH